MNKPFSSSLFYNNDALARNVIKRYYFNKGIKLFDNPDKYGIDLFNKDFKIEVQIVNIWKRGNYPFKTIHLTTRKEKFIKKGVLFYMISNNLKKAIEIKAENINTENIIFKKNKYSNNEMEAFFEIPLKKTKCIDLII